MCKNILMKRKLGDETKIKDLTFKHKVKGNKYKKKEDSFMKATVWSKDQRMKRETKER